MSTARQIKRLGYLSGAPRVSTAPDAEASGPRSHVLGVINAFEFLGWDVNQFIVGDQMPRRVRADATRRAISGGALRTLATDLSRLTLGQMNAQRAWRTLNGQVDIVYERFAVLQSLGKRFARHGIPWVLETSGPFFYEAKVERNSLILTDLAKRIEFEAYRNCDLLVCVSQPLKEIIMDSMPIDPDKIIVLPNGVDTNFFDPQPTMPIRIFDDFTIGYVGSLLAWQSVDILLEAVHNLRMQGLEVCLVIVGDGPAKTDLEAMADRLSMQSYVRFTGRVSRTETPRYIAGFDAGYSGQKVLAIGKMYHSPLKIYEYMAMGKPVIASTFDDAQAVTQGGQLGYLFEGGHKADLQDAIVNAYRGRQEFPIDSETIRAEVVEHHSWVSRVRTLLASIEDRGLL